MSVCKEPSDRLTDEVLAARAAAGDEDAFAQLVTRTLPLIQHLAARYRWQPADAEDLAQEGLLGLFGAVRHYTAGGTATFMTYAAVCIRNRMNTFAKNKGRAPEVLSEDKPMPEPSDEGQTDPAALLQEREDAQRLDRRLRDSLTVTEYEVLVRYLAAYAYDEIAGQLHISPKSVDNALQRARRKLAKGLPQE